MRTAGCRGHDGRRRYFMRPVLEPIASSNPADGRSRDCQSVSLTLLTVSWRILWAGGLLLAATLFAHASATFGVHVSAGLDGDLPLPRLLVTAGAWGRCFLPAVFADGFADQRPGTGVGV